MKKWLALLLMVLLLTPCALAEKWDALPSWQQMKQIIGDREYLKDQLYVLRTYPDTVNDQVDGEMRALIDEMTQRGRAYLPTGKIKLMPAYLDVGATVFRTGEKWMSFLTIARIAYEREQIYVDYDARVYNMETGERLTLAHLFDEDSFAWDLLSQEVEKQLSAYFMTETAPAEALSALSAREALEQASFTLTPAKLSLHFRADQLYPGKNTLMHVHLYYSQLREYMTDAGLEITDNSRYKMIALTYDDGGARGTTLNVIDQLRRYGANATFFVVGTTMRNNHDVLSRQHDAGFAVQSHNYEHTTSNVTAEKIHKWRQRYDTEMDSIIGVRPTYMRAPGGKYIPYVKAGNGLPLIHWSVISDDAGSKNVTKISSKVIGNAQDGGVILMHDLNTASNQYSQVILENLEKKGYLFVTVDELFVHYGITLQPDTLYYSCEEIAEGK